MRRAAQPLSYGGRRVAQRTWAAATPPSAFAAVLRDLTLGADRATVDAARARVEGDLALSPDAFIRLCELQDKDLGTAADAAVDAVTDEEWAELASIFAQADKRRAEQAWLEEGQTLGIRLGPATFWVPLQEPDPGRWPSVVDATTPWIDPEMVALEDLPGPLVGAAARTLWHERLTAVDAARATVRGARAAGGVEAMLTEGFGPAPNGAGLWPSRPFTR